MTSRGSEPLMSKSASPRSTSVLTGLLLILGIVVVLLSLELRRRSLQLDQALGLVARADALETKLDSLEAQFSAELERELTEARTAWDALMYQKAQLEVRKKHDESLLAFRVIGTGLGAYQVDYNFYPPSLDYLGPNYVAHVNPKDAWGNEMRYETRKRETNRPHPTITSYRLTGAGQDGALDSDDDYRYEDGMFTYIPDVRSLEVEPLALPGEAHEETADEPESP